MSASVYHFSDTARLPWILLDRVLRPGHNTLGGFPDPDFLWATTLPIPDRTASSAGQAALRALRTGQTRTVRFTLRADDFDPWPQITSRFPDWTPDAIQRLERAAKGQSSPGTWRCRAEPLPQESWLAIETRGWSDRQWTPLDLSAPAVPLPGGALGVCAAGRLYCSEQIVHPGGNVGYSVAVMAEQAA
jgi:hypothetical protein